jgi:hypothetical protein
MTIKFIISNIGYLDLDKAISTLNLKNQMLKS